MLKDDTPLMKTVLSAGTAVYEVLSERLADKVTKVFPVVTDEAVLPYVCYHREALETAVAKHAQSADTATIVVDCYAATYNGSVALAEAVREALDNVSITTSAGLTVRSSFLVDAAESWTDDAYVQSLTFKLRC
jgi:hypothetical protein